MQNTMPEEVGQRLRSALDEVAWYAVLLGASVGNSEVHLNRFSVYHAATSELRKRMGIFNRCWSVRPRLRVFGAGVPRRAPVKHDGNRGTLGNGVQHLYL